MKGRQLHVNDEVEALVAEQAVLLVRELRRTCRQAAYGQVLDQAEGVILGQGREFLRQALQTTLQEQAQAVEKKGRRLEAVAADANASRKADANEPC